MSGFWKHYEAAKPHMAGAVDDVRHKLVEEGWFGRQTTGNIAEWNGPEPKLAPATSIEPGQPAPDEPVTLTEMKTDITPHKHHDLYDSVWGKEPEANDLYGKGPIIDQAPAIEPPKTAEQGEGLEPGY